MKLVVTREAGWFVLRVFKPLRVFNSYSYNRETIRANSAQEILDYCNATWPVGTIVNWRIQPRYA